MIREKKVSGSPLKVILLFFVFACVCCAVTSIPFAFIQSSGGTRLAITGPVGTEPTYAAVEVPFLVSLLGSAMVFGIFFFGAFVIFTVLYLLLRSRTRQGAKVESETSTE